MPITELEIIYLLYNYRTRTSLLLTSFKYSVKTMYLIMKQDIA